MGQRRKQRRWAWTLWRTGAGLEPSLCRSEAAPQSLSPGPCFCEVGMTVLSPPISRSGARTGCCLNVLCQRKALMSTHKGLPCQSLYSEPLLGQSPARRDAGDELPSAALLRARHACPFTAPSQRYLKGRSQTPLRGSATHILIQIKFLLAHHGGAGFGFGEILEAAGALEGELEKAEVGPSVAGEGLAEPGAGSPPEQPPRG